MDDCKFLKKLGEKFLVASYFFFSIWNLKIQIITEILIFTVGHREIEHFCSTQFGTLYLRLSHILVSEIKSWRI